MDSAGSTLIVCVADGTSSTGYRWRSMNSSPAYLGASLTDLSPQRPGDASTGLFSDTTDPTRPNSVSIATNGVERVTVNSSGYVGIGTSAPTAALDVGGWLKIMTGSVSEGPDIYFNAQGLLATDTNMFFNINGNGGSTGQFIWETGATTAAATNIMTLTSTGNLYVPSAKINHLGIGTAAPDTAKIDIGGWLQFITGDVADGPDIYFNEQGLLATDTNMFFNSINGGSFFWKKGGNTNAATTIMRLTGDGFLSMNRGNSGVGYPIYVGTDSTNGNGAKLTAAGAWSSGSDVRSKENIRPIHYGMDTVMKLKPVAYEMKKTHEKQVGFIAQDVQGVVPEVVSVGDDGLYGLSYGNLVAVTVRALQEIKVTTDELKEENKKLRDEVEVLRESVTKK